jgi:N-acetylmuramoyl-L-alanine amidase
MADLKRTKQRILRQAVQENIDTIHGRPPTRHDRNLGVAVRSARLFFFLTLPVAVFVAAYIVSTLASGRAVEEATVTVDRMAIRERQLAAANGAAAQPIPPELAIPTQRIDPAVFPVAVKKIVLDPGHGGENLGTTGPGGLVEKELTLDIAHRLRELLEERSFHVVMTRTHDAELSLEERALIANETRGDIFVSIHVNWFVTRQVRGVETYFLGATDDPYLSALAAKENQGSGYSLADLRDLIEEIYANARMGESLRLASAVQRSLYRSLHRRNPELQDRGVKTAPFGVLTRTGMPAILAEVACLSNAEEAGLLMTADYRQYIAKALFDGIDSYSSALSERSQIGS